MNEKDKKELYEYNKRYLEKWETGWRGALVAFVWSCVFWCLMLVLIWRAVQ